jgi:biopolymer transport protein TolR
MQGYRSSKRRKLMAEINVVPYIDVSLVLLVIFMITAPLLTQGVDVQLPQAAAKPMPEETEPVVVTVTADGDLYIDKDRKSPEEVQAYAVAVRNRNKEARFMVRGDANAQYRYIVKAMVLLQQAGVPSVGMITEPPDEK